MAGLTAVAVFFLLTGFSRLSIKRSWTIRADLIIQVAVMLATCGIIWMAGGNTYSKGILIYRHFFVLAAAVVAVTLLAACLILACVWGGLQYTHTYREAITKTELFLSRSTVITPNLGGLIRAFLTVVPGAPLQLLLIRGAQRLSRRQSAIKSRAHKRTHAGF